MSKRFYKKVVVVPDEYENGFLILLDGKSVMTPAQRLLKLPTEAMANLVVNEFCLQREVINLTLMPITRLINSVIDSVFNDFQPIVEDILRFTATDMLFYRADSPHELVVRQNEHWDPILDWVRKEIGASFITGSGIVHIEQSFESLLAVSLYLRRFTSPFALAALHIMTTLTGSALITLCMAVGEIDIVNGWQMSCLDENWTAEQWGEDDEAVARRNFHENEIRAAMAILDSS
ncbi:MAG: ATPase [Candidatus Tokpelaia sp. JSC188]|nr:MAG: ATPase [Candidatus Tokpelaia sp. JSC188]